MLLSENWLRRMYACCKLYVHQIFGTFMYVETNSSVRSWQILYVNYVLQYVNGNAEKFREKWLLPPDKTRKSFIGLGRSQDSVYLSLIESVTI